MEKPKNSETECRLETGIKSKNRHTFKCHWVWNSFGSTRLPACNNCAIRCLHGIPVRFCWFLWHLPGSSWFRLLYREWAVRRAKLEIFPWQSEKIEWMFCRAVIFCWWNSDFISWCCPWRASVINLTTSGREAWELRRWVLMYEWEDSIREDVRWSKWVIFFVQAFANRGARGIQVFSTYSMNSPG